MAERIDGAGQAKLNTLEDAQTQLQRVHAIVERMATAVRTQGNIGVEKQQVQRAATPLVGLLKPQFGVIADHVTQMILAINRGGGDQMRVRNLRENVAQIRTQIEIMMGKVREQHTIESEKPSEKTD